MNSTTTTMRRTLVLTMAPSSGLVLSLAPSGCAEGSSLPLDSGTAGPSTGNPPANPHAGPGPG